MSLPTQWVRILYHHNFTSWIRQWHFSHAGCGDYTATVTWLLDIGCITFGPGYPLPYIFIDLLHPWNVIYLQENWSNQIQIPLQLMQRVHLRILSWTISSTSYHSCCLRTYLCWCQMHKLPIHLISTENTCICIYVCIHWPLRLLIGKIVSRILEQYSHNLLLFLKSVEIIVSKTESL